MEDPSRGTNHDAALQQASELVELERSQIGHEIHDGLLPPIFAASAVVQSLLEADRASPLSQQDREKLQSAAEWLNNAMTSGRGLLHRVYPPELIGSAWTRAAKDTVNRLCEQSKATIDWHLQPEADEAAVPISIAAYRIVVEAVRNATSHGDACQITVDAAVEDDSLVLTVTDDGCGFDPAQVSSDRFGIRSMKGRALLVGGALAVDSSPQRGTTVKLTIPRFRGN